MLSAGPTPHTPSEEWTFSITRGGQLVKSWTWPEFQMLPAESVTVDIHCVTRWSKFDTEWRGVSVDTLLDQAGLDASFVMAFCDGDYTTNLSAADITGGKAWVAFDYDGGPLAAEHGGPARLLVPHLYFWKSAKWVRRLTCVTAMSRASGKPTDITCMEIHGGNSATRGTRPPAMADRDGLLGYQGNGLVVTIGMDPPDWPGHRAGQHLDVRLTAEDGYTAEREYSIASAPGEPVAITVERLDDGEVSPYLTEQFPRRGRTGAAWPGRRVFRLGRPATAAR